MLNYALRKLLTKRKKFLDMLVKNFRKSHDKSEIGKEKCIVQNRSGEEDGRVKATEVNYLPN